MPSALYAALGLELGRLRTHLLPPAWSLTGQYLDEEYTRAYAYRVLAHAEVEGYLEERVLETAIAALADYSKSGNPSQCIVALLAYSGDTHDIPPKRLKALRGNLPLPASNHGHLATKASRALNQLRSAVKANHGVKEQNAIRLLVAVGVPPAAIDPQLLIDLNTFGRSRGTAAHTSKHAPKANALPDPKAEYQLVERIHRALLDVDKALDAVGGQTGALPQSSWIRPLLQRLGSAIARVLGGS